MSNEELQKAIDDITKETSADEMTIAPAVPMDSVPGGSMPSGMMPAGRTAADAMPVSDAAAVAVDMTAPIAPPPAAPAMPEMKMPAPAPTAKPAGLGNAPRETVSLTEGVAISPEGLLDVATATASEKSSGVPTEEPATNLIKVKQDALRELFPLMDKLNIDPVQKFSLYKDIIALTKEHAAIEQAHDTILQIADEQTRADALLELLEIIAGFKV